MTRPNAWSHYFPSRSKKARSEHGVGSGSFATERELACLHWSPVNRKIVSNEPRRSSPHFPSFARLRWR